MRLRRMTIDAPIGPLTLVADDKGLTRILFATESPADVGVVIDDIAEDRADPVLHQTAEQLGEYFALTRTNFELPLHLEGSNFEREAWRALASIPFGETITYGEQAVYIGRPGAFRAVGAANGHNPIPIVLPCHRVVGADGSLVGFGGGLEIKQRLLDLERGVQRLPF